MFPQIVCVCVFVFEFEVSRVILIVVFVPLIFPFLTLSWFLLPTSPLVFYIYTRVLVVCSASHPPVNLLTFFFFSFLKLIILLFIP